VPYTFPSGHEVVSLLQFAPECGDLGRIILEIRVHGDDDGSLGFIEADS
jgi:hypothetical protein